MLAMRGGLAIAPTGTELRQLGRVDLGQKFDLARIGPDQKLPLKEAAIFLLCFFASAASLLVAKECFNRFAQSELAARFNLFSFWIDLGFEFAGQLLRRFPTAGLRGTADLCAVEENAANPFGTVTAPPVSITGVYAFGEMASVEVEHFAASFRISELAPSVEANQNSRKSASWKGNFRCRKNGPAVHRRYTAESLLLTY
jgi:hypothetical protein